MLHTVYTDACNNSLAHLPNLLPQHSNAHGPAQTRCWRASSIAGSLLFHCGVTPQSCDLHSHNECREAPHVHGVQVCNPKVHTSTTRQCNPVTRTHGHWIVNDYGLLDSVFSKGRNNSLARLQDLLPQHASQGGPNMMLRSKFNHWVCAGGFGTPCARGVVSANGLVMDACSVGGMMADGRRRWRHLRRLQSLP